MDTCSAAANCTKRKVGKGTKVSPADRFVDEGFEIIVTMKHKPVAHRHSDDTDSQSRIKTHSNSPSHTNTEPDGSRKFRGVTTGFLKTRKDKSQTLRVLCSAVCAAHRER